MDQYLFRIAPTRASQRFARNSLLPVDAVPVAKECELPRASLPPVEMQSTQIGDMRRDLRCKLQCTDLPSRGAGPHHKLSRRPKDRQTRNGWANPGCS